VQNVVLKIEAKTPLLAVSFSDIISLWITNTVKPLQPFSRSQSEQIFFGVMSSLYSSLWALKFQKAMAQEFVLR